MEGAKAGTGEGHYRVGNGRAEAGAEPGVTVGV